jgi:hypothetical protein
LLAESGLAIVARNDLTEAAQEAVRLAAQHAATASAA